MLMAGESHQAAANADGMQASISAAPPQRPVVWAPIPRAAQELALDARAQHILYFGTRGPGKTDTQLMRFKRRVSVLVMVLRGVASYLTESTRTLDDLVIKSKKWYRRFHDGADWLASTSAYKWVWPTGEELLFRSIKEIR
jgi:hypothetical protein